MAEALNYATQYQQALDQVFERRLHFQAMRTNPMNAQIRWLGGKSVRIPTLSTTGNSDRDRDGVTLAQRNFDISWQTMDLKFDRDWNTSIDPMDIDEGNMVATIQNIGGVHVLEHTIPERDKYFISKAYAEWLALDNVADTTEISAKSVLQVFDRLMEQMTDSNVPETGRVLYITPQIKTMLISAADVERSLSVRESGTSLNRDVMQLDNVQVVTVPSDTMRTLYDFKKGANIAANSAQINMFLGVNAAILNPMKYQSVMISPPTAHTKDNWIYFERYYEDVFVLENKAKGLAFNITAKPKQGA